MPPAKEARSSHTIDNVKSCHSCHAAFQRKYTAVASMIGTPTILSATKAVMDMTCQVHLKIVGSWIICPSPTLIAVETAGEHQRSKKHSIDDKQAAIHLR